MDNAIFSADTAVETLLDEVARHGEVTITGQGVAVARLVPIVHAADRADARQTAQRLRNASRGVTLGDNTIRNLIEEGRR